VSLYVGEVAIMATSALLPAHLRNGVRRRRELFDRTTGLPGPVLLLDRIEVGLAHAKRRRRQLGVFYVDLQSVGHQPPDLRGIAEKLEATVRPDDTVAEDGDGNLVVVCHDLDLESHAERVTERLLDAIAAPCRFGVALGCPPTSASSLIAQAMNRAIPRATTISRGSIAIVRQ
jgi:GGDEF domain-containing protein